MLVTAVTGLTTVSSSLHLYGSHATVLISVLYPIFACLPSSVLLSCFVDASSSILSLRDAQEVDSEESSVSVYRPKVA